MSKTIKIGVAVTCFALAGVTLLWTSGALTPAPEHKGEPRYNEDGQLIGSKGADGRTVVSGGFTEKHAF